MEVIINPWPLVVANMWPQSPASGPNGNRAHQGVISGSTAAAMPAPSAAQAAAAAPPAAQAAASAAAGGFGGLLLALLTCTPPPQHPDLPALKRLLETPGGALGPVPSAPPEGDGEVQGVCGVREADTLLRLAVMCLEQSHRVLQQQEQATQQQAHQTQQRMSGGVLSRWWFGSGRQAGRRVVNQGLVQDPLQPQQPAQQAAAEQQQALQRHLAASQQPGAGGDGESSAGRQPTFGWQYVVLELSALLAAAEDGGSCGAAAEGDESAQMSVPSPPELFLCPITHEVMEVRRSGLGSEGYRRLGDECGNKVV